MKNLKRIAGLTCMLAASASNAHYLWLEQDAGRIRLYYGEAEALLRERSPGALDGIRAPQAFTLDERGNRSAALPLVREADSFASERTDAEAVAVMEESTEVRDLSAYGLGHAKSNYYARYGSATGSAQLPLDLKNLPGHGTNAFVVLYRGQPLRAAKLTVIAPNAWIQEHKTDERGAVRINTPWRGRYLVHVLHVDPAPGEHQGKAYASLRNHFTYSFINGDGGEPGPAHPAREGLD